MALIEGVGDEVTILLAALTTVAVLLLAWASTRTSDPPQPRPLDATSPQTASLPDPPAASAQPLDDHKDGGAGEGPAAGGDGDSQRNMVLRLKFLNDTERTAHVKPQDTVGYIKRTYFAGQECRVRLIYQGQLLQDDGATLETLHLAHNCVLHCHVSQHATPPPGGPVGTGAERVRVALNAGGLMVPLLVLMLAVLWYCQIQYRHLFTAPASASLLGITVFLSLLAFGVYRH
ncbi:transmembrane and ubiquitin-like domain-containing protein 1 isoform X2 [Hippocampus comes]|uniref:Transmembrane and ubiquitin-like domain-containing protein 1 n=2 Tax=Hippocampus comes TaxID=109280 RepID=A0A3Q3DYN7_HIPCM|nr:PREDICTED: transmembrane and ubiquitin-like domain-containing protein 1 isoform X2 [Hippocampus comes]XP_019730658.1 PREDICTED: transmembrane and ubiquitin-like domain-containing protein 1 isoform X2 [Hippocampus comes]